MEMRALTPEEHERLTKMGRSALLQLFQDNGALKDWTLKADAELQGRVEAVCSDLTDEFAENPDLVGPTIHLVVNRLFGATLAALPPNSSIGPDFVLVPGLPLGDVVNALAEGLSPEARVEARALAGFLVATALRAEVQGPEMQPEDQIRRVRALVIRRHRLNRKKRFSGGLLLSTAADALHYDRPSQDKPRA